MPQNMEKKRFDRLTLLAASERRYPKSPDEAKLECFDNLFSGRDYVIEFDCPNEQLASSTGPICSAV